MSLTAYCHEWTGVPVVDILRKGEIAPFRILLCVPTNEIQYQPYIDLIRSSHVILISDKSSLVKIFHKYANAIRLSGIKIGVTWGLWQSNLANFCSKEGNFPVHVFHSYGEVWRLVEQWTVRPVSSGSGIGESNWFFEHSSSEVHPSIHLLTVGNRSCIEQRFFQPLGRGWAGDIDSIFFWNNDDVLTEITRPVGDIIKAACARAPMGSVILFNNAIEAVATILQLAHGPGAQEHCILIRGRTLIENLNLLPSMFEWLHEDVKTYLLKCAKFRQSFSKNVGTVLCDLILSGRIITDDVLNDPLGSTITVTMDLLSQDSAATITVDRMTPLASMADVEIFFKPRHISTSTICLIPPSNDDPIAEPRWSGLQSFIDSVFKRYGCSVDQCGQKNTIAIPGIETWIEYDPCHRLSIKGNPNDESVCELITMLQTPSNFS